jgi:poly(hydroxyalkanoate) granule-associated protein
MATRKSRHGGFGADDETTKTVADSAQRIWLAGLGAFERAKAEGPRMFEVLVEQGRGFAERAQGAAADALRSVAESAGEASGRFDKFEQAVEERLTRSASRLGLLTRGEVEELSKQVHDLAESVREMMAHGAAAGATAAGAAKRRGKPKAAATKRKAKRAVSRAKAAAPRAGSKTKRKAKRAAS